MYKFILGCARSSVLHGVSLDMESRDCSLDLVHGLLIAVASLVAELRLQGTWASVDAALRLSSVSPGLQRTVSIVVANWLSCSVARGIFPDQGSNQCLLHWQTDSLPLSHQESPLIVFLSVPLKENNNWATITIMS